ncbi:zinc-dependent dehydrogenase [Mesorhizobium sp. INR15]|uniref:zinc-dependent dehydrogenase n=1 Tax=Mesorhizobium sp. INR15 TaxID=2654248 RepID=UPI0018964A49|nr:zinc-dependent dehydrogenase [Mesorhizobium sp. INR15]QPC94583.1 alcohol dehydrogenase catalytic domain-containing protein [Mesorhizobium sp. INR15]
MQAAIYEGIEKLVVRETASPDLPEGGVLLKVKSCAICGTDLRTYHHGSSFCEPPWIIGHEVAGEVVEVAKNVSGVARGDRVTVAAGIPCGTCRACTSGWMHLCSNVKAHGFHYPGGFAEYMAVNQSAVTQKALSVIGESVTYDQAALAEPLSCVINGQELVNVTLGDTVVVIGAGPIGCMHVEVARARGAVCIIHVEQNRLRLEKAMAFGADYYVDASKEDAVAKVMEITGGRGANVVISACAAKEAQGQAVKMAALRGRVSFFGGLPKSDSIAAIDGNIIHYKELAVFGAFASSPSQNRLALDLITSGKIRTDAIITHKLPLVEIVEGIGLMDRGEALKVVIHP